MSQRQTPLVKNACFFLNVNILCLVLSCRAVSRKVFAGSANELESQQGMAHLVEHVAYMGSRKRYLLAN